MVAGIIVLTFVVGNSAFAQNLLKNGSFEDNAVLSKADEMVKKGFTLEFDSKCWAKGWVINDATNPASISLVAGNDVPDGKRYLNVKSPGWTHIFTQESISGESTYKISFMARGNASAIKILAYLYKKADGAWAGKNNNLLGTFNLDNSWKEFSLDLPAVGNELVFRLAFEFQGSCDLDNVKVEKMK